MVSLNRTGALSGSCPCSLTQLKPRLRVESALLQEEEKKTAPRRVDVGQKGEQETLCFERRCRPQTQIKQEGERGREGFNGEERGRDGATGVNKQEDECFQLQCFIDDTPQAWPCINHTSAPSLSLSRSRSLSGPGMARPSEVRRLKGVTVANEGTVG